MQPDSALTHFLADLRKQTNGDVRTDETTRTLYSTDASLYQVMPLGVCFPRNADEVAAIVTLANQHEIPLLPRAGGTGLAGQTVNEALVIDFSHHMDQLLEVNVEERWAKVQPGLVFANMNKRLKQHGLMFGPDPASGNRAGLGGIVGNNATGSHSILYGMAVDHVIETEVVLSDGSLARFGTCSAEQLPQFAQRSGIEGAAYRKLIDISTNHAEAVRNGTPKHWRRCGGYNLFRFVDGVPESPYIRRDSGQFNLAQLMTGSEGTLGVMTEFKLNIVPTPQQTALAIVHFDDAYTALEATQFILEMQPSAVELFDKLTMRLCREHPIFSKMLATFIEGTPNSVLVTEFYGHSESELKDKVEKLEAHLKRVGINFTAIVPLMTPRSQEPVWKVRKAGLGILQSRRGDFKPAAFIEDTAVPVHHLAEYITRLERFCHDIDVEMAYYAHASGGCLHVRPLVNTKSHDHLDKMIKISHYTLKLMHEYGGSFSSEHGDGRARSWLNESFFGPDLYQLFREVKETFDPKNLLNPGNIVNSQGGLDEAMRFGRNYTNVTLHTNLDFSPDQGFHRAVEMCNGAGVCRKHGGTMCPPYMVTREEEHSTRGRANMLRAALTGKIPAERLTEKRMYETMDLCISCKACKSECPSSVDMAKIKTEFLDRYHAKNGTPLRAKLFGNIHRVNRMLSGPLAPVANWVGQLAITKKLNERFLGVGRERDLPTFARESFVHWFKNRPKSPPTSQRPKVVLFNDTFNTYNSPHVSIAATEVLEAAGFEVILPEHNCCGRPMLSKGLINDARQLATDTIDKLYPFAAAGIPIVGLEPSCLLSFRDDYHYLLPNDDRVQAVSDRALLFEEFIAQLADKGALNLMFKPSEQGRDLLLHGHCHQKAIAGTETAKQILALPGYNVTEIDSGCCGMAGSFGYEKEHVEISLAMGNRALFPAIKAVSPDTIIAASGTSCREQIADGTGRVGLHSAEILRNALTTTSTPTKNI
ncbi:MAG: FAD-binding and (Fe-S)-binding domain-containing protein [Candidatus Promineifilaceae bacterium]